MEELDLDINNYSIKDIETFFKFSGKNKYTEADIELREYEIREQLLNSGHINKRFKRNLIEFLTLAKDWLIFVKCNHNVITPTTIPKNYKLDPLDTPLSNTITPQNENLINRNETQYINVMNDDFFPGTLNPLKTRIITKCLNIDTRFRDNIYNTKSSDFTFNLPTKFNKVVSMQLASLELPVTFYGISKALGNNFLYLQVNYISFDPLLDDVLDASMVVYIPDGNYNSNDLLDIINNQICPTNSDNSVVYPDNPFSYLHFSLDITLNGSGSGKVNVQTNGLNAANINYFTMDFSKGIDGNDDYIPINTKLGWNLGFQKQIYTGNNIYTSETIIEPSLVRYIYLVVDDFNNSNNNHFISVLNKSILNPNILARIAIQGSYFSIIMQSDFNIVSQPRKYFGPVDIQKLKIQLIDEYGRILDMNNSNFSFCINLKMLYDL